MKDIKKGMCDDVYTELEGIKDRMDALRMKVEKIAPANDKVVETYGRHLKELSDQIEWKLQIISHTCSYDWKGSAEYEDNVVSVGPREAFESDYSGGYLGG
jgi:archaellum component FlaC